MFLGYFLNDFQMVPVALIIAGVIFAYIPRTLYLYCKIFIIIELKVFVSRQIFANVRC